MFASVFINLPIKSIAQAYTYIVPNEFLWVEKGCRVVVPFGNKLIEGFVIEVHKEFNQEIDLEKIKKIHSVLDQEPWFTENMYMTAKWMSEYFLCSLGEAMRLFIPGKNSVKIETLYSLAKDIDFDNLALGEEFIKVLRLFQMGKTYKFLCLKKMLLDYSNLLFILNKLVEFGYITVNESIKLRSSNIYRTKYVVNYYKLDSYGNGKDRLATIMNILKKYPAQRKAMEIIINNAKDTYFVEELKNAKITLGTIKNLVKEGFLIEEKEIIHRNSYNIDEESVYQDKILTDEQKNAIQKIINGNNDKFLLFGITGSGKTQVYIELAKSIENNEQILILVPEIVLTGQLVKSLQEYFGNDVAVIHSRLTVAERHDTFNRIRLGMAKVIIGARSALFAPFTNLKMIILDEEHDSSYKQDEAPRYHGRDLALAMGKIYKAKVILASATPSVESYYKAINEEYTLLVMSKRIGERPLPKIKAVDMRTELKMGNRKILSRSLQQLITDTLKQGQQIIIMLNRRGFSTFVMCRNCGYVVKCKECTMPMVYHRRGILQCHHCDVTSAVPVVCPSCGSKYIKYFGSGTEKLEQELEQLYPNVNILRLDRDTTTSKFAHQEILEKFRSGKYPILLGTQMVAKGHDIPNVTAVGIISADSSINMPEFRAGERCFSLITQTAGRAGRGMVPGKVIVQAYSMDHYALEWGIKQDYVGFYNAEIPIRKILFFPPYSELIKLTIVNEIESEAIKMAEDIKEKFNTYQMNVECKTDIMGPAPAVISLLRGKYRYNLLLKSEKMEILQNFLKNEELDLNMNVLIDVNPININ